MFKIFIILVLVLCANVFAKPSKKIVYKYKKYESFDFEKMSIDGTASSPGDLSINPRFNLKFKNNLPQKPNLSNELLDSMELFH